MLLLLSRVCLPRRSLLCGGWEARRASTQIPGRVLRPEVSVESEVRFRESPRSEWGSAGNRGVDSSTEVDFEEPGCPLLLCRQANDLERLLSLG